MNVDERISAVMDRLDALLDASISEEKLTDSKALTVRAARTDDYQQIKNLMGRYASYHYYAQHLTTYDFFSHSDPRTTAELGSTGVYAELDKIYQMFSVFHEYNEVEHTAHCHPLTTPYIIVAKDRGTAKIFMLTPGFEVLPGNMSMWFYDGYDTDFVREKDGWKWLRFHLVDDIKAPFYLSWGLAGKKPGPSPEGLVPPTYFRENSFVPYGVKRKPSLCVQLPEPYETY